MAKKVRDSKKLSDQSRTAERDITGRDANATGGSDAMVTNKENAPNDAAPIGANPDQVQALAQAQADAPPVAPALPGVEDPSRTFHSAFVPDGNAAPSFPGFPKTKYHPVYGARTVEDPNQEAGLLPPHNWFNTAEEADAHRTDREAQMVIHQNRQVKVDAAISAPWDGAHDLPDEAVRGEEGVVRNSVSATESLKRGAAEPL